MRQPLAYNVLQWSIHRHAKRPVVVQPLLIDQLPIKRRGLTDFTFTRFLVPWLCNFEGKALFMDADMVVLEDINDLFDVTDDSAVSVMQDQPKFEWASMMMFNNERCRCLTPEMVGDLQFDALSMRWASTVGEIPKRWNQIVGYGDAPPGAACYHYTQGIPAFYETHDSQHSNHWHRMKREANFSCTWKDLMGTSVHAKPVLEKIIKRYLRK